MELHQFRYFCAVVDTGSFSRAAEQSHVSQPSLSQQILKLEDELGARLFDRLGRSVRLTALGATFLPRARAVLAELEAVRGEIVESKGSLGGSVTVGVIPTVAPYYLPPLLTSFSSNFPQARLTVVEEITPVLLDRLRAATIDIAILALPVRGHEFQCVPLLSEPLFAVVPKDHALAGRRTVSLRDLRTESFLLLRDGHCFRETSVAACTRARLKPRVVFESGQFSSLVSMVSAGMGVSIVPEMAIRQDADCRYIRVEDDKAQRVVGAVVLRGRSLSRLQVAFLRHVQRKPPLHTETAP
jgi:LysR family hydrogen peroxide-inducible transcriptional activator